MKKVISILLAAVIISGSFLIGGSAEEIDGFLTVEPDTGNIVFDVNYPEIGKKITASVDGRETEQFLYKWYIDKKQLNVYSDFYTPCEGDMEKMLTVEVYDTDCEFVGEKSVFLSTLPVIYIETENRQPVVDKAVQLNAQMKIQGNNEYNDSSVLYDGKAQIKGRGNSTWAAPKKPYKIKLDSKSDLFGMGKSKHWVLLSNPYDTSNMRNDVSYKLSEKMGLDSQKCVWTELVLNGKSVGIYQLIEHIRIEENRVNITNWDDIAEDAAKAIYKKNTDIMTKDERDELVDIMTENMDWVTSDTVKFKNNFFKVSDYYEVPPITGGYLLEASVDYSPNRIRTSTGVDVVVDSPEGIGTDMMSYINDYFLAFDRALMSNDFCTEYQGKTMRYTDFIDVESFAKGILINEIFENSDFGTKSTWMSKDIDGKLVFGPIWDMDYTVLSGFNLWVTAKKTWIKKMLSDPVFMKVVRDTYFKYRFTAIKDMISYIDSSYEKIYASSVHNDKIWGNALSFEDNVEDYKYRIQRKINWLDQQFQTLDGALSSVSSGAAYLNYIYSSNISLILDGSSLTAGFSAVPAYVKVFVDGELYTTIENPSSENILTINRDGEYTVTVLAYDSQDSIICGNYITNQKYIKSLAVSSLPNKTEYASGDKIDLTGLVLNAVYSDGITKEVNPGLVYTYTKDSIGAPKICYDRVSEQVGSVYAVVMAENVKTEFPISITASEDYTEVQEYIDRIPADSGDPDYISALFEAEIRYDSLSSSAKSKVDNYSVLEYEMTDFTKNHSASDVSVIGVYGYGVTRQDTKDDIVVLCRKKPRNVIIMLPNGGKTTYGRDNKNVLSIKKVGTYELWTINHTFASKYEYYDFYSTYQGSPQVSSIRVPVDDMISPEKYIKSISFSDFAYKNSDIAVDVMTGSRVQNISIKENGDVIEAAVAKSDGKFNITASFDTVGRHEITLSCLIDGKWVDCRTFDIYVREPLQEGIMQNCKCPDVISNGEPTAKVITDSNTESVILKTDSGEIISLTPTEKNGYKVWSGVICPITDYTVLVNGIAQENNIRFNPLRGDLNYDGMVNSYDALMILQHSTGIIEFNHERVKLADLIEDGFVNSADALRILMYSVGQIESI